MAAPAADRRRAIASPMPVAEPVTIAVCPVSSNIYSSLTTLMATSLETSSKGVIFEEATASIPAEGLRRALKPVIDEVTKGGGSRAEREVAIVLRGIERGARHEGALIGDGETAYLDLVGRVFQQRPRARTPADKPLIVLP